MPHKEKILLPFSIDSKMQKRFETMLVRLAESCHTWSQNRLTLEHSWEVFPQRTEEAPHKRNEPPLALLSLEVRFSPHPKNGAHFSGTVRWLLPLLSVFPAPEGRLWALPLEVFLPPEKDASAHGAWSSDVASPREKNGTAGEKKAAMDGGFPAFERGRRFSPSDSPDLDGATVLPSWLRRAVGLWRSFCSKTLEDIVTKGAGAEEEFARALCRLEAALNGFFVSGSSRGALQATQVPVEGNPLLALESLRRVELAAPEGFNGRVRLPAASHFKKLCPFHTPESKRIGLQLFLSQGCSFDPGELRLTYGNKEDEDADAKGSLFSLATGMVPYPTWTDGPRLLMGGKNLKQAVSVDGRTPAEVCGALEGRACRNIAFSSELFREGRLFPFLGTDALVAVMPWEGYTFEDGLAVSRAFAERLGFTDRVTLEATFLCPGLPKDGVEERLRRCKKRLTEHQGTTFFFGDELPLPEGLPELFSLSGKRNPSKLYYEHLEPGTLTEATLDVLLGRPKHREERDDTGRGKEPDKKRDKGERAEEATKAEGQCFNAELRLRFVFEVRRELALGDKLTGRSGNKGVVACILDEPPRVRFNGLEVPVDLCISPWAILKRKNLGQVAEMIHGLALWAFEKELLPGDVPARSTEPHSREELATFLELFKAHLGMDEAGFEVLLPDGKMVRAFVGRQYICRLKHHAAAKLQARGTSGPFSALLQEPLAGGLRSGQRFGEMENWALLSAVAPLFGKVTATPKAEGEDTPPLSPEELLTALRTQGTDERDARSASPQGTWRLLEATLHSLGLDMDSSDAGEKGPSEEREPAKPGLAQKPFVLRPLRAPRLSWAEALQRLAAAGEKRRRSALLLPHPREHAAGVVPLATPDKAAKLLQRLRAEATALVEEAKAARRDARPEGFGHRPPKEPSRKDLERALALLEARTEGGTPGLPCFPEMAALRPETYRALRKALSLLKKFDPEEEQDMSPDDKPDTLEGTEETLSEASAPPSLAETSTVTDMKKKETEAEHVERKNRAKRKGTTGTEDAQGRKGDAKETSEPSSELLRDFLKALLELRSAFVALLSGKFGLLRRHLLGRRLCFSGRAVIVPDPETDPTEVRLPAAMLLELLKDHDSLRRLDCASVLKRCEQTLGRPSRAQQWKDAALLLDEVLQVRPLWGLLVRQPSLHRHSVTAFRLRAWEHHVIGLPPLATAGFNADFDGDTMAVFLPPDRWAKDLSAFALSATPGRVGEGEPALADGHDLALGWDALPEEQRRFWLDKAGTAGEASFGKVLRGLLRRGGEEGGNASSPEARAALFAELGKLQRQVCRASTGATTLSPAELERLCRECEPERQHLLDMAREHVAQTLGQVLGNDDETALCASDDAGKTLTNKAKEAFFHKIGEIEDEAARAGTAWLENNPHTMLARLYGGRFRKGGEELRPLAFFLGLQECFLEAEYGFGGNRGGDGSGEGRRGGQTQGTQRPTEAGRDDLSLPAEASARPRHWDAWIEGRFWGGLSEKELFVYSYASRKAMASKKLAVAEAGHFSRRLAEGLYDLHILHPGGKKDCSSEGYLLLRFVPGGPDASERIRLEALRRGRHAGDPEGMGEELLLGEFFPGDADDALRRLAWGRVPLGAEAPLSQKALSRLLDFWRGKTDRPPRELDESPFLAREVRNKGLPLRSPLSCALRAEGALCAACAGADPGFFPYDTPRLSPEGALVGLTAALAIGERGTQLAMKRFHQVGSTGSDHLGKLRKLLLFQDEPRESFASRLHSLLDVLTASEGQRAASEKETKDRRRPNEELPQLFVHFEIALAFAPLMERAKNPEGRWLEAASFEGIEEVLSSGALSPEEDSASRGHAAARNVEATDRRLLWERFGGVKARVMRSLPPEPTEGGH